MLDFSKFKTMLYKNYGENPGKMLVHTGTLGWILSSLAQITAIGFNDKISGQQKSFLIPQEIADATVNIISFYAITNTMKTIASKLVSTGKLTTPHIKQFLMKNNLMSKSPNMKNYVGKIDFDISKIANFDEIATDYKNFKNGVDVVASTLGSILSCNIITPIIRNQYAANEQKKMILKNQQMQYQLLRAPRGISMADYQKNAYAKFSSGNLKV